MEEYIGVLLKEIYNDEYVSISTQEKNKYLLWNLKSERNEISLKPDIVVYKNDKVNTIIDTKWKSASISNKEVYFQGDIYQMYSYIISYL